MSKYADRARFYEIRGLRLPSVTTVLDVISKPALGPWYAAQERRYFEQAMKAALAVKKLDKEKLLERVGALVKGIKAADQAKHRSASIGQDVHAAIEAYLKGREVQVDEANRPMFEAWLEWWKRSGLRALAIEKTVYSLRYGYAGTMDLYAELKGRPVVIDWKTTNAVYPESYLQNIAYRHAALECLGLKSVGGFIVRVPKNVDPKIEVRKVPQDVVLADFLSALHLWRWQRRMAGLDPGYLGRKAA